MSRTEMTALATSIVITITCSPGHALPDKPSTRLSEFVVILHLILTVEWSRQEELGAELHHRDHVSSFAFYSLILMDRFSGTKEGVLIRVLSSNNKSTLTRSHFSASHAHFQRMHSAIAGPLTTA